MSELTHWFCVAGVGGTSLGANEEAAEEAAEEEAAAAAAESEAGGKESVVSAAQRMTVANKKSLRSVLNQVAVVGSFSKPSERSVLQQGADREATTKTQR